MKNKLLLCLLAGLWMAPASATPLLWTLQDVSFEDGGTASGSFVYDADTDTYSLVSVTTTAGGLFGGASYSASLTGGDFFTLLIPAPAGDLTGSPAFDLQFQSALSNAGGVVSLFNPFDPPGPTVELTCTNVGCSTANFERFLVDGVVFSSAVPPVPVPAAAWLFLSAGGALALVRRRRTG